MKNLLGGKGANLHEMASLGLPVPPASRSPPKSAPTSTPTVKPIRRPCAQVEAAIAGSAARPERVFGDPQSAARLGALRRPRLDAGHDGYRAESRLNDASVETLAETSGDARFAYDFYRRFIQMYSNVVLDLDIHNFEEIIEHYKDRKGYELDTDLTPKTGARSSPTTKPRSSKRPASRSRKRRATSSGARSARCSRPG